jgi:hypothetical protein
MRCFFLIECMRSFFIIECTMSERAVCLQLSILCNLWTLVSRRSTISWKTRELPTSPTSSPRERRPRDPLHRSSTSSFLHNQCVAPGLARMVSAAATLTFYACGSSAWEVAAGGVVPRSTMVLGMRTLGGEIGMAWLLGGMVAAPSLPRSRPFGPYLGQAGHALAWLHHLLADKGAPSAARWRELHNPDLGSSWLKGPGLVGYCQ